MSKIAKKPEFLEKLRESTGVIGVACKKVGIDRKTYYRWIEDDKEFAKQTEEAMGEGKSKRLDLALSHHVLKLQDGSDRAVYFELDRRHPDYRQKIEVSDAFDFDNDGVPKIHERHEPKS